MLFPRVETDIPGGSLTPGGKAGICGIPSICISEVNSHFPSRMESAPPAAPARNNTADTPRTASRIPCFIRIPPFFY
jgi:hypothetical protein